MKQPSKVAVDVFVSSLYNNRAISTVGEVCNRSRPLFHRSVRKLETRFASCLIFTGYSLASYQLVITDRWIIARVYRLAAHTCSSWNHGFRFSSRATPQTSRFWRTLNAINARRRHNDYGKNRRIWGYLGEPWEILLS